METVTACPCWQDGQPDILSTFWTEVTGTLGEEFHRATGGEFSQEAPGRFSQTSSTPPFYPC